MRSEQNMPCNCELVIIQGLLFAALCKAIQARVTSRNVLLLDLTLPDAGLLRPD
jgi:hypothetical protein